MKDRSESEIEFKKNELEALMLGYQKKYFEPYIDAALERQSERLLNYETTINRNTMWLGYITIGKTKISSVVVVGMFTVIFFWITFFVWIKPQLIDKDKNLQSKVIIK